MQDMLPQFGLIGRKLVHSFSKKHFTEKFSRLNLPYRYELFELAEIEEVLQLWEEQPQLIGLNVTNPYKQLVIPFLDSLSPAAAKIGAVNTIKLQAGKRVGYNTDVIGFRDSLQEILGHNKPSGGLILGTGGASKAVYYVLKELEIPIIRFASRHPAKPDDLSYAQLKEDGLGSFPLVVNTTPLGTYPKVDEYPNLDYGQFSNQHIAFDLVYNPAKSRFLVQAEAQGAKIANGLAMLIGQAEAAWEIWQGTEA